MYKTTMNRGSIGAEYIASRGVVDVNGRDINNVSRETVSHVTRMEHFMEKKTTTRNRRSTSSESPRTVLTRDEIKKFTISF